MDHHTGIPQDEQQLVEEARRDAEAFRSLYQLYFPKVYAYVIYRVGRAQDAEDLTSQIFMKAVEGFGRFRWQGDGSFAAWVFRIARHEVVSFYRRCKHQTAPLSLEELPEIRGEASSPEDVALRKERFALLFRLVNSLPPRRREVITLKFFAGLRNREIAQALELDERTVASHLCRGLEELHRKYQEEMEPEKGRGTHGETG